MKATIVILVVASILVPITGLSQSDQNFKVEGATDCHEGQKQFKTMEDAEAAIRKVKFNIEQEMNTTRPSGYMKAHFRSCDMKTGYLLILIDSKWVVFRDFPLDKWNEYVQSRDLEGYYLDNVKEKYPRVTDPI